MPRTTESIFDRFINKINFTDTCWLWKAVVNKDGYGIFGFNKQGYLAHRLSYEWFIGTIPKGLEIDHLCRDRSCVRPDHLEAVTYLENMQRGDSYSHGAYGRNKTVCVNGHEFTEGNTHIYNNKRKCKECGRIYNRRSYWRNKEMKNVNY